MLGFNALLAFGQFGLQRGDDAFGVLQRLPGAVEFGTQGM
jgi:hypothetical protein